MSEFDYSADPNAALENAYAEDPLGVTAALVAAGIQQATAQTAASIRVSNDAVYASQASIAATQATQELRDKYGDDWDKQAKYTEAVLAQNPHLIPSDDSILDVPTIRNTLEIAYRSGREDAANEAADRRWQEIKNAPSGRLDF